MSCHKMAADYKQSFAGRKFYDINFPKDVRSKTNEDETQDQRKVEMFKYLEENCIGQNLCFSGPYGARKGE